MSQPIASWSVLTYVAIMPWATVFVPNLTGHDSARIAEVLVCTTCGLCLAYRLWDVGTIWCYNGNSLLSGRRVLAPIAIGALAIVSTAFAPVAARAAQELLLVLGLVAVSLVIAADHSDVKIRLIARAIVAGTITYNALTFLILCGTLLQGYSVDMENLALGYVNRRFFNHVQTVALPLLATILHQRTLPRYEAAVAWVALITGFAILVLSGGRGTLLALVGATILSPLWLGRLAWPTVRPLAVGLFVGTIIYLAIFILLAGSIGATGAPNFAQRLHDSSPARQYLWSLSIDYLFASPWVGTGPMHFAYAPNLKAAHPHNIYLQIAVEWGIPLLLIVLIGGLAWLHRMIRLVRCISRPADRMVGGSLILACVAICIDGLVSGNFVMPVSQVWIAICFGMAAQWARSVAGPRESPPKQLNWLRARFVGATLALAMLIQSTLLLQDIVRLEEILNQSKAISISERRCPRFWGDGWIVERPSSAIVY